MSWTSISAPKDLSRLLYCNPVCLLTAQAQNSDDEDVRLTRNIMTISWLSPTDNAAHFTLSLNRRRFTSSLLESGSFFVLNIPTNAMRAKVLETGRSLPLVLFVRVICMLCVRSILL